MSTQKAIAPVWSISSVLWICILAIMAGFQTWRGAYVDGILFFSLVAMLVIDRLTGGRLVILKKPIHAPKLLTLGITGALGAVLVFAPRHSWVDLFVFIALGITVLLVAWEPAPERIQRPRRAYARSMWMWSMLSVAICLWEATAFVMSVTLPGGSEDFPTISLLLDPFVENTWGRMVFVGLWLAAGYGLLRFWRRT